jgi:hypothetical protein
MPIIPAKNAKNGAVGGKAMLYVARLINDYECASIMCENKIKENLRDIIASLLLLCDESESIVG